MDLWMVYMIYMDAQPPNSGAFDQPISTQIPCEVGVVRQVLVEDVILGVQVQQQMRHVLQLPVVLAPG